MIDARPTLSPGDLVELQDGVHIVESVDPCGALVRPAVRRKVEVNGRRFKARGRAVWISPYSPRLETD